MASLKFIMDIDDDHPESRGQVNTKNSQDPASHPASPCPPESSFPRAHSSSTASAQPTRRNANPVGSPGSPGSAGRRTSLVSSGTAQPNPVLPPAPASQIRARRQSTASNDSMDPSGYASAVSSSSRAGGGGPNPPRTRTWPVPSQSGPDIPVKLTPITGRVSRARKGIPVHTCDMCNPPKTFTRAEHLRRHQLSHQTPAFPCTYPGCDKAFHRPDLLARHQQRQRATGQLDGRPGGDESQSLPIGGDMAEPGIQPQAELGAGAPGPGRLSQQGPSAADAPEPQRSGNPEGPGNSSSSSHYGGAPSGHHGGSERYSIDTHGGYHTTPAPAPVANPSSDPDPSRVGNGLACCPMRTGSPCPQPQDAAPAFFPQGAPLPSLQIAEPGISEACAPDVSPWASSASDSTYSTPTSDASRSNRSWPPRHQSPTIDWNASQLLSPYPNSKPRETQSASHGWDVAVGPQPHMIPSPFPPATQFTTMAPQPQRRGSLDTVLDVPMSGPDAAGQQGERAVSSPDAAGALVAPVQALPDLVGAMSGAGRQKAMAVGVADALPAFVCDGSGVFALPGGLQADLADASHGAAGGGIDVLAMGLTPIVGCGVPAPAPLPRTVRAAIPGYVAVYWQRFDRLYPIVHRASFEAAGEDVLRCVMAAVGTQYLRGKADRIRGSQLHEYAWQELKRIPQWNLQVMQAVLLCELFARFRGRRAVTRPSKQFESLYSRVLYYNPAMLDPAVSAVADQQQSRWLAWLDAEARRRLLTACFVVDVHTSAYQQQRQAQEYPPPVPLTAGSAALWAAASASSWAALVSANPAAGVPTFAPPAVPAVDIRAVPELDRAALLALELLHLGPRQRGGDDDDEGPVASEEEEERLAAHFAPYPRASAYLALRLTPLQDLLAVSGDSWVFSRKVLKATSFAEHQRRLRAWAASPEGAAAAAPHAARAVLGFLSEEAPAGRDLGDYWGLYASTLVCWAFGHRGPRGGDADAVDGETAMAWLRWVARGEAARGARGRKEADGFVGLVRRRLEQDCIGGRSRLYVDAVGVLSKLEEGADWKWF